MTLFSQFNKNYFLFKFTDVTAKPEQGKNAIRQVVITSTHLTIVIVIKVLLFDQDAHFLLLDSSTDSALL